MVEEKKKGRWGLEGAEGLLTSLLLFGSQAYSREEGVNSSYSSEILEAFSLTSIIVRKTLLCAYLCVRTCMQSFDFFV